MAQQGIGDGELSLRRRAKLDAYLAQNPELQALRDDWASIGSRMQTEPVPRGRTPEATWANVQRSIRLGEDPGPAVPDWHFGSRLRVAGTTMAALLAVLAVAWFTWLAPRDAPQVAEREPIEVEWVETDLPDAVSMVYQDQETGWTVIWVMAEEETNGQVGS